MVRQAGGRKGWRVLPPAQKTKKMKSRAHFPYLRDENVLHHTSKEETHVAILGVTVVIAFSVATCGAFSVSSTAECLKDSELVRKDTELRLNIPERGVKVAATCTVKE